ncbi:glycosyltransferase family 2 protein [Halorubrum sp. ARQ200]|uniref:glycosyltransferase family 2 protein n=1 Tax=Halorubrum sp. ARQ200 TaxID=1855872 RepID=UPI0010F7EE5A|nr:glycosyltransferase family 2 protein [Halorubrum sp. ARQ200]TKX44654.1 glycosyltransferase family 2 protein [Halorubrum sp. ARQ200]
MREGPDNIRVSIVVPSYSRPNMLEEAIRSILSQTYEDFEVIVVDDGSPKPLKNVIDKISDKRVRYYRLDKNKGANVARNAGIDKATGNYIAFLDDDDRWEQSKLEEQVTVLDNNPNIGFAYTGQKFVDETGKVIKTKIPSQSGDVKKYLLRGGYIGGFSSIMLRENLISIAGKPDPELPILQDTEWWLRLSKKAHFTPIEKPLVIRRMGDYQQIGDKYEQLRDVAYPKVYNKHKQMAADEGIVYKLLFKSYLLNYIGSLALSKGRSNDAREYLLKSWLCNPFSVDSALRFIISLGGSRMYHKIRAIVNKLHPKRKR